MGGTFEAQIMMKTDVISCYRREVRWAKAKKLLQDLTYAAGVVLMFCAVLIVASEIEMLFEAVK